jgi:glutamate-1-semialdehyde 2,1-aminomutase
MDPAELQRMLDIERDGVRAATPRSALLFDRASRSLARGVSSDFQFRPPYPIYLARGSGSNVWDVDGNCYVDFHAGAGSLIVGHANPILNDAMAASLSIGTSFAAASEHAVPVAEALAARFGPPLWRFTSSGTEAVMGAVRLARAATSRDRVLRIVHSYNGHADVLLAGETDAPPGIPLSVEALTSTVAFNDVAALEGALGSREFACVVVELPLCTPHVIRPTEVYLEALRALPGQTGTALILDDVKTGLTLGRGGSPAAYDVRPDLIALAKSLTGGLPCGAIGGQEWIMSRLGNDGVAVYGTLNGNPLAMTAAHTILNTLMTNAVHDQIAELNRDFGRRVGSLIAETGLPLTVVTEGGKGGMLPTGDAPAGFTELLWTWVLNHGAYLAPDPDLRWTITAAHKRDDVDLVCEILAGFAAEGVRR